MQKKCIRLEQLLSLVILSKLSHYLKNFDDSLMMFMYSLGIVPNPITLLFTRNNEIHHHDTRHSNSLHPMIGRTEATYKTFRSQAILIWNYISKQILINVTITCFKKTSLK